MKRTFNIKQIAQIALKVRQHKKLFVTTEGQMFVNAIEAEEAVRVKNMVIDEPDDYVGVTEITEDMVSDDKLRTFARDTEAFGKLFEKATIPRTKETKKPFERKRETPTVDDAKESDSVAKALGIATNPTPAPASTVAANPAPEVPETKKIIPASSASVNK